MTPGSSRGLIARAWNLTLDQRALLTVLAIMGALSLFRAYHMHITSFIVSDEYRYVRDAIGNINDLAVADRFFFLGLNAILFKIFAVRTLDDFVIFLPFYLFAWSGLTLVMFYKIMKLFGFEKRTISLSLLSSLILISYSLLSLGFLTESLGLAMAMVGIYLLVWYTKRGGKRWWSLLAPFSAAFFFAAAAFTREPYYIFLIGGMFVVLFMVLSKHKEHKGENRAKKLAWVLLPIIIFSGPALYFSHTPHDFFPGTFNQVVKMLVPTQPTHVVVNTVTSTTTTTTTVTLIEIISNGTTTYTTGTQTANSTTTQTTTTTTTTEATTPPPPSRFHSTVLDTLNLFVTGLVLGWTPLIFIFGVIGTVVLLYLSVKRRDLSNFSLFMLVSVSLGSYLVVSLLAVTGIYFNQDYLAFQHYSTIIRFSDTAVPAYFLVAPFAFGLVARNKKLVYATLVGFLLFGAGAYGVYQAYAASNLGLQGNPFSLDYRTGGALVRDYIIAHPQDKPFHVVGFPAETWQLTVGTSQVDNKSLDFYATLSEDQFIQRRWPTFYVYGYNLLYVNQTAPFLVPLLYPNSTNATLGPMPFTVVDRAVEANSTAFLVRFDVKWNS